MPPAAMLDVGSLAPLAAVAAATTLLMLRLRSRRQVRTVADRADSAATQPSHPPRAVERWETELFDYCREVEARLDVKIAALQQLIVAADERIAHLDGLGLDEPPRTAPTPAAHDAPPPPHFADLQARRAAVFAMSDAGRRPAEIANRLRTTIAEIEAILCLRMPRD